MAQPQIEPVVAQLHVVDGTRLEDAVPCAATLVPPARAARGREGECLFILLDLAGPASSHLYRELREAVAQAYWSTVGSITAALRQAAAAANRYLFQNNVHAAPSDRCDGSLICAVAHGDDLYVLQAGSAHARFLHGEHLQRLSRDEELPPLGLGRLADVRLQHAFVAPGDTLLLTSSTLIEEAGDAGLTRVLSRTEVQEVEDGLEQIGAGADFAALVVRWVLARKAPAAREVVRPRRELPQPAPRVEAPVVREVARPKREPPRPKPRVRPKPARKPGPGVGERILNGLRAVGRGVAAAGVWLAGGVSTLFRRMLPGPAREAGRRARPSRTRPPRPVPGENRTVMMAIAITIPIVVAIVVVLAYLSLGARARSQGLIDQAEEEIALAQAAGGISEEARPYWEAALEHAGAAITLRPGEPVATTLHAQAQDALDRLDGIVRLQPVQLWDFGLGTVPRRLVTHGQTIFTLDPAGGWVAQLTLNPTGDGVVEQGSAPILVQTGQQIGEGEVGGLVDFVWIDPGGERQTGSLLVLEEDGALVGYDPAWVSEGGTPRLARSLLGTSPDTPRVVGSFGDRFYVLDVSANQIWRYEPRGDAYPDRPDRYFVAPPPRSLADAQDMAIDGHIHVLYSDGTILKFLQGEPQSGFEVRDLPSDIVEAVALAVDPHGSRGVCYVADRGDRRVVALGPDGTFQAQFRAEEAFDALEALAVDEAAQRIYVISNGRLYVASLP